MGTLLAALGVLVLVVAVLVSTLDIPRMVLTLAVVVAVGMVVAAGATMSRSRTLVHLDDEGYQVRWLRGAGVKQARWRDVEDVVTATVSGHDCVVVRLKDGRTTTVPIAALDAQPEAFVRDLVAHLDRGHGYRRLS